MRRRRGERVNAVAEATKIGAAKTVIPQIQSDKASPLHMNISLKNNMPNDNPISGSETMPVRNQKSEQ